MIDRGDVVLCIDDGPMGGWKAAYPWIKRGRHYRVEGAITAERPDGAVTTHVTLAGVNPPPPNNGGWMVERFRKMDKLPPAKWQEQIKNRQPVTVNDKEDA